MKIIWVVLSVMFSVLAQVLVKVASRYILWDKKWLTFIFLSIGAYGLAFLLQTYIMRLFPLSRIAPAMAIAIMLLVFLCGVLFFDEQIAGKQIAGILLGGISIYLVLS